LARTSSREDPEQIHRYIDARADLADAYARQEQSAEEIEAHRRERRLIRLLIGMVLLIVAGGFIISIVGILITGGTHQ
jgi:hypothetical protein